MPAVITTTLQNEIDRLYASITEIDTVYASIANVDRLYQSITAIDTVYASINNIDILANALGNISTLTQSLSTLQRIDSNFTTVVNMTNKIDTISSNITSIQTVGNDIVLGANSQITKAASLLASYQKLVSTVSSHSITASTVSHSAALSEANAKISENNAKASETSAKASEIASKAAETSATTASNKTAADLITIEKIFDNFDDEYLGSASSDPTVDHDNNPLQKGAVYWNTTSNDLKFYDGTIWRNPNALATSASTAASNSANSATSSAATATIQANNAKNSATTVTTVAANVASLFDMFRTSYMGDNNTAPTQDYAGNPIKEGAMYYNTVTKQLNYYDGTNWLVFSGILKSAKDYTNTEISKISIPSLAAYAKTADVDSKIAGLSSVSTSNLMDLTTDQTVSTGIKTFTHSPVVPIPTTDNQVTNKKYVDDYVNKQDTTTLKSANDYTDSKISGLSTGSGSGSGSGTSTSVTGAIVSGGIQRIVGLKNFEKGLTTGLNILSLQGTLATNNGIGLNANNTGIYGDISDNSIVIVSQNKEVIRLNTTSEFERLELAADHDDILYFGSKDGVAVDKVRQPHISYYQTNNTLRFRNLSNLITGNFSNKAKGYSRLSNNLSLQWTYSGVIKIPANGSSVTATVTFPKSFNSKCLVVFPVWVDNTVPNGKAVTCVLRGDPTVTGVSYRCKNLENFAVSGKVVFLALGA